MDNPFLPGCYILDDSKRPVPVNDLMTWGTWMEANTDLRQVARTKLIDGSQISTVFLGINHNFMGGRPLLFETALMPSDGSIEIKDRYATWAEAELGHMEWAEKCALPALGQRAGIKAS